MNHNAIIATLVIKGILSREEADRLVEHINNKPQSSHLSDAIAKVQELLGPQNAISVVPLGPIGPEQANEEAIARTQASAPPGTNVAATEFPTLPGANESTGNDLSISEMSDTAKETNITGNQQSVVDTAKDSDNAPAKPKDEASEPKSTALKSAVKKSTSK